MVSGKVDGFLLEHNSSVFTIFNTLQQSELLKSLHDV